jgi:hypothetical protein
MVRGDGVGEVKRLKLKIHFNRVNMQRGDPRVWTVHYAGKCLQAENVIMSGPLQTVFRPEAPQPRAYFTGYGTARLSGKTVYVEAV